MLVGGSAELKLLTLTDEEGLVCLELFDTPNDFDNADQFPLTMQMMGEEEVSFSIEECEQIIKALQIFIASRYEPTS